MKKLFIVFIFSQIILTFLGCKKEEVAAKSKTDLLGQNSWTINEASFNPGIGAVTVYKKDASGNVLDASKISLAFKSDGTITATDLDGKGISGTWKFNNDETKITLPPGLPFTEVTVEVLTDKNFDISVPQFEYPVFGQVAKGVLSVKMIPKA